MTDMVSPSPAPVGGLTRTTPAAPATGWTRVAVWAALLAVAVVARLPFLGVVSADFTTFLSGWYDHLAQHGFAGLGDHVGNYEPLYLYLLLGATSLPAPPLLAVKLVSMAFDLALMLVAYRIVSYLRPGTWWPYVAAGAVAVTPTVVLNSAAWAQCDAIFATFTLLALDALLRRRTLTAAAWWGLAMATKPQAVFLLPLALIVLLVRRVPVGRALAAAVIAPAVFVLTLLPAVVAGESVPYLLGLYPDQVATGGVSWGAADVGASAEHAHGASDERFRGGLTYNAASFYQWLPGTAPRWWGTVGYLLAGSAAIAAAAWALRRRDGLDGSTILVLAAALAISTPFFLPSMHDRYFYLADVLTVIAACVRPRLWPTAVAVQAGSLLAYLRYLWGIGVPLWLATTSVAAGLVWIVWHLHASSGSAPVTASGRRRTR